MLISLVGVIYVTVYIVKKTLRKFSILDHMASNLTGLLQSASESSDFIALYEWSLITYLQVILRQATKTVLYNILIRFVKLRWLCSID